MTRRVPLVLNSDVYTEELQPCDTLRFDGEYAEKIPLPKPLAQRLWLTQGRGTRASTDYRLLHPNEIRVDPDMLYIREGVRNLRIWIDDACWEWDSAGRGWLRHKVYRGDHDH